MMVTTTISMASMAIAEPTVVSVPETDSMRVTVAISVAMPPVRCGIPDDWPVGRHWIAIAVADIRGSGRNGDG